MLFLYPMCVKYSIAHWSDREYRWLFWVNVHFPLSAFLSVYVEKRLFHYQLERVLLTIVRQQLWGEIAVIVKLPPLLPVAILKLKKMANRTFAYPSAIFLGCSTVFLALFPLRNKAWGYCPKLNDIGCVAGPFFIIFDFLNLWSYNFM